MARFKNSYFETTGWRKAEHITIQSEGYLEKLLLNGFEIQGSNFKWMPNKSSVTLYLKGKKRRLIADANDIDEYVIHLQDLYDFDKKKTRFTWVPDTSIYWNFQDKLIQMLTGEFKKPILKKKMDSALNQKILRSLRKWVESKKEQLMPENGLSSIFSPSLYRK